VERRLAIQAPVLEVHHQVAERSHVGDVEPEVQRTAVEQALVHVLDVVGEGRVVEAGEVDVAVGEVGGDQGGLPLALPPRELGTPALRLEGLLGAPFLGPQRGVQAGRQPQERLRRRREVATASDLGHEPPVELAVHPLHVHRLDG
jgi:hypothetical protein